MGGFWDIEKKGLRTTKRLGILKRVTRQVVSERPELKQKQNHGRLCSAVFARLKQSGYFSIPDTPFYKRLSIPQLFHSRSYAQHSVSVKVQRIWNEKEFFYKGNRAIQFGNANYHWTRRDIIRFATATTVPVWMWILIAVGGFFILKKLLK